MMRQNKARLPGCGSQPHTQFKMLSLIHSKNTPFKPPAPLSLMQTYFQTLRRTQAGLSAWLFQLNMSSARCSLCPLHATVPGSREQRCPGVWREGLPGAWDGGSEAQPGRWQAGPSSRRRSGKGSNSNLMAGCYPLAGRDTATLTRAPLPQRAAEPVRGHSLPPCPQGRSRWPRAARAGLGWFRKISEDFSLCQCPNTQPKDHLTRI